MKKYVICFGIGGHAEQGGRFIECFEKYGEAIIMSDDVRQADFFLNNPFEKVGATSPLLLAKHVGFSILAVLRLRAVRKVKLFISLGPGICLVPSFVWRLSGGRVVHIETWSRFNSRSVTASFLYKVAHLFVIQNQSLHSIYPRAKYGGRL